MPGEAEKALEASRIREETLRQQREGERLRAEEEARRLQNEAYEAYRKTKDTLEEHINFTKEQFSILSKEVEKIHTEMAATSARKLKEEWEKAFTGAAAILQDTLSRALQRSVASVNVGDFRPGLGRKGEEMGGAIIQGIATALGHPTVGRILGKAFQLAAGPVAMQLEGYNMLGARVAPMAYGTGGFGQDFEETGRRYREMMIGPDGIVRASGATVEEAGKTLDALSKLGVGFLEAGKAEATFALQADKVLNLQSGTTLALQSKAITQYGEDLKSVRTVAKDMAEAIGVLTIKQRESGSSITAAFTAGQMFSNTLEQVASSARNSGASLEALSTVAIFLVKTMTEGAGAGMMRPEQIVESGGRVTSALMPGATHSGAEEQKRSGLTLKLFEQHGGKFMAPGLVERIMREGDRFNLSQADRRIMFNTLASMHLARGGGGRGEAVRYMMGQMGGLMGMMEQGVAVPWEYMKDRKLEGRDLLMMKALWGEFQTRQAEQPEMDPGRLMKQIMREKRDDPEYRETIIKMRNISSEAKKQGDAATAQLDKIADSLSQVSIFVNRYWTDARDSMANVFGLAPKPSILNVLSHTGPGTRLEPPAVRERNRAGVRQRGAEARQPRSSATEKNVFQKVTSFATETWGSLRREEGRNRSDLGTTGD